MQLLADKAAELDCAFIATGTMPASRWTARGFLTCCLLRTRGRQSAALAGLPQEVLAKLVLPLGEFTKAEVTEMLADTAE